MVNRRLTDLERREIASGDVFVFDEAVSGIKRWADGRLWSSSRMRDCFLIYIELGMAAGISGFNPRRVPASSPSELLRKKVLSITTSTGQRLRLVAYSSALDDDSEDPAPESNITGLTPRRDARLASITIPSGIFHSNTGPMSVGRGATNPSQSQQPQPQPQPVVHQGTSAGSPPLAGASQSKARPNPRASSVARSSSSRLTQTGMSMNGFEGHQQGSLEHGHSFPPPGVPVHSFNYHHVINGAQYHQASSSSPRSSCISAPANLDGHPSHTSTSATSGNLERRGRGDESVAAGGMQTSTGSGGELSATQASHAMSEDGGHPPGRYYYPVASYGDATGAPYAPHVRFQPQQLPYQDHPYYVQHPASHYPQAKYNDACDPYALHDPHSHLLYSHPGRTGALPAVQSPPTAIVNSPPASTTPSSQQHPTHPTHPGATQATAPSGSNNPYLDGAPLHGFKHGPFVSSHPGYYGGRYSMVPRPRFHPSHHHHPPVHYDAALPGASAPSSYPAYRPITGGPPPATDFASDPLGAPTSAATGTGTTTLSPRAAPPLVPAGRPGASVLDLAARNTDTPTREGGVPRADSGMYLGPAARDHRDRPYAGAWHGAAYHPVTTGPVPAHAHVRMGSAGSGYEGPLDEVAGPAGAVKQSLGTAIGLAVAVPLAGTSPVDAPGMVARSPQRVAVDAAWSKADVV